MLVSWQAVQHANVLAFWALGHVGSEWAAVPHPVMNIAAPFVGVLPDLVATRWHAPHHR